MQRPGPIQPLKELRRRLKIPGVRPASSGSFPCNAQGGSAACINREAENFRRSMGYVSVRTSTAETIRERIYLADVLRSRWN